MVSKRVKEISTTLTRLADPGISPKRLLESARKEHPDASRKEVVRAAFYALITSADTDPEKARRLQSFAIAARPLPGQD